MAMSMLAVIVAAFLALILCSIVFFIVSLVLYTTARREYRELPRPELQKPLSRRKVLLTVSSIIMGTMLAVVIGIVVMFYFAIAYM